MAHAREKSELFAALYDSENKTLSLVNPKIVIRYLRIAFWYDKALDGLLSDKPVDLTLLDDLGKRYPLTSKDIRIIRRAAEGAWK